jgi:hypothetical protein
MALSNGTLITRRGAARGNDYGYPAAPGVKIWRGAHLGINAAGQVQPIQTAGSVSYVVTGGQGGKLNLVWEGGEAQEVIS